MAFRNPPAPNILLTLFMLWCKQKTKLRYSLVLQNLTFASFIMEGIAVPSIFLLHKQAFRTMLSVNYFQVILNVLRRFLFQ
jgi:hypothetical protein